MFLEFWLVCETPSLYNLNAAFVLFWLIPMVWYHRLCNYWTFDVYKKAFNAKPHVVEICSFERLFVWTVSKMQPLATTRKLMMWLCMCPVDETTTRRQRIAYIAHTLAILIICVISITTGLAYCIKFISIDFDGAVFGFMAGIAEFGIIYVLIAAVQMRYQIELIFTGLLRIYKSSKMIEHLKIFFWKMISTINFQMKIMWHFDTWFEPITQANEFVHFTWNTQ